MVGRLHTSSWSGVAFRVSERGCSEIFRGQIVTNAYATTHNVLQHDKKPETRLNDIVKCQQFPAHRSHTAYSLQRLQRKMLTRAVFLNLCETAAR